MFENKLIEKFKRIFKVSKVVYQEPGASQEQECLFITVENVASAFSDGNCKMKVTGTAVMFGYNKKLTFGFFSKAVANAENGDTKDLFLYDFEENTKTIGDIVQRSFSFVYFFSGQYDPNLGSITSLQETTNYIEG